MTASRTVVDADRNVSTAVVEAVAEALGVSPVELDPPLHRVVNPDALDDLFHPKRSSEAPTLVSFTYAGCDVTIRGSGDVEVRPESEPDPEPVA